MRLALETLIGSGQIEDACKIISSPNYHETEVLTDVPVMWYIEEGHLASMTYTENIQCIDML